MKTLGLFIIAIILAFSSGAMQGYKVGHNDGMNQVLNRPPVDISFLRNETITCQKDLAREKREREHEVKSDWEYVRNRCVCVMYMHEGISDEAKLSKEQICSIGK